MTSRPDPVAPPGRTPAATADPEEAAFEAAVGFVMELGEALHAHGAPAHRLEEALSRLCDRLGIEGQFFSTPTFMLASFQAGGRRRMRMVRIQASGVDLGRLAELDAVSARVARGTLSPAEGAARVREVVAAPARYGAGWMVVCGALSSGAGARFFGGGWPELAAAAAIGGAVAAWSARARRPGSGAWVFEAAAAFAGTVAATCGSGWVRPLSVPIALLGGLISLFPGLPLTVAMTELATRNLVSGTARLAGAAFVFLSIAFGVALGDRLGEALVGAPPPVAIEPLGGPTEVLAVGVAGLALSVLFRAQPRDLPWTVAACALAFAGARAGASVAGPELGTFLGALGVGVASNAYARALDRPAAVPLVPGIMLLVPGSVGFRSVSSMLASDVVTGVEWAFTMALLAASLVAGLLMSNALVPPRRAL